MRGVFREGKKPVCGCRKPDANSLQTFPQTRRKPSPQTCLQQEGRSAA
jgi:hypothetical protein